MNEKPKSALYIFFACFNPICMPLSSPGYQHVSRERANAIPLRSGSVFGSDTLDFREFQEQSGQFSVCHHRGPCRGCKCVGHLIKAPELENPVFSGFHGSGSWTLTGEMRPYNKRNGTFGPVPVAKSIHQGGLGAWELSARYSSLDFSNGLIDGGNINVISLGLNWYLTATFTFNLNFRHIVLDRFDVRGHSSGTMARVIVMLE